MINPPQPFTFKFDPISSNGVTLAIGDIVFQMMVKPKQEPELLPLKVIEIIKLQRKIKVLPLHPNHTNIYIVDPKDVHTEPKELCSIWIKELEEMAAAIPNQVETLKKLSLITRESIADRQMGSNEEVEI